MFTPFFVVYLLEGQTYKAVFISMTITSKFEVSLHFWRSWPTVCPFNPTSPPGPTCCDGFKRREFTYWGGLYASFAHALIFEVSVASLYRAVGTRGQEGEGQMPVPVFVRLFQPGGQILHVITRPPTRIFRPSYGPGLASL